MSSICCSDVARRFKICDGFDSRLESIAFAVYTGLLHLQQHMIISQPPTIMYYSILSKIIWKQPQLFIYFIKNQVESGEKCTMDNKNKTDSRLVFSEHMQQSVELIIWLLIYLCLRKRNN